MSDLGIDPGLLERLRAAGATIAWTTERGRGPAQRRGRLARLSDEQARVLTVDGPGTATVEVTAGPVGALVLLLEADRRGPPSSLGARNAGRDPAFPDGSIVAAWGEPAPVADARPSLRDLVELARYALR